mmetsp:Transcript_53550/g.61382  ORF Transcript_53550/g.61382 Transcript_53550/m.61382 type:complete len:249 (-) Transcript_53550:120-866(-)
MSEIIISSNTEDLGVFNLLSDSYLLTSCYNSQVVRSQWQSMFERVEVVETRIAQSSLLGVLTVGNNNGILLPSTTNDEEMAKIAMMVPEKIEVARLESFLNLGNVIKANDTLAVISGERHKFSPDDLETIQKVLKVEELLYMNSRDDTGLFNFNDFVMNNNIAASSCWLPALLQEQLGSFDIPNIHNFTINRGNQSLSTGLLINDTMALCGKNTTVCERDAISHVFFASQIQERDCVSFRNDVVTSLY